MTSRMGGRDDKGGKQRFREGGVDICGTSID